MVDVCTSYMFQLQVLVVYTSCMDKYYLYLLVVGTSCMY